MALIAAASSDRTPPLMLKDYLLIDDFSSCSSNEIKSFPRRQCCTTVRFLLEIDLKKTTETNRKKRLRRSRPRAPAGSTTISALQRASEAVVKAVKKMHFSSVKSPSSSSVRFLPRSLSRKLLRRKAEKEEEPEIKRCRSFGEFLEDKNVPFDQNTITVTDSGSWSSNAKSWDVSMSNSESWSPNDDVQGRNELVETEVGEIIGVIVGDCSTQISKVWTDNESEEEQFSPVSVLDCPFEDEEDEIHSPFHRTGSKQPIRRFEKLSRLEPVELDKRIELILSEIKEDEALQSPMKPCSIFHTNEDKSQQLLKRLKGTTTVSNSNADNFLLDFFTERIEAENDDEHELLKEAENWVNGDADDLFGGWEIELNRKAYVRDMEKNERWTNFDEQRLELAMELEAEIFTSVVHQILFDLTI